jgi:cobalt-zinc-cadmium efflux system protein
MGSGHDHGGTAAKNGRQSRLFFALFLTALYMVAEFIGGVFANSLALIADAGHMLTDVAAMGLTIFAFWIASRPATRSKTYGYYRVEILAAFFNGVALVLLSVWVIYEAVERWRAPQDVRGTTLTIIAAGGLVVNIIVAGILHSGHKEDLNLRGAWLHVIGDMLGSIAAIITGILIVAFGWFWVDAVSSVLISLIIIYGAGRLVAESTNILLEGTPRHIDLLSVESVMLATEGVTGVHDLHVWTISSGIEALSAHVNHEKSVPHSELLSSIRERLNDEFHIEHLTIQMETTENETEAVYICETGTKCFEPARQS